MDSHNLSPFGSDLKVYILEATSRGGGGGGGGHCHIASDKELWSGFLP